MKTSMMKKLGAFFTAAAIAATTVLSGASFVSAADPAIMPEGGGTLKITKYLEGATGTGVGDSANGKVNTGITGTPVEGVRYTLYEVEGVVNNGIVDTNNYPQSPINTVTDDGATPPTYSFKDKTGTKTFTCKPTASPITGKTKADGTLDLKVTTSGVYLVIENTSEAVGYGANENDKSTLIPASPFVVSLPMTDPDGEKGEMQWLKDVYVYPKNTPNVNVKTVDKPAVDVGQTQTFTMYSTIPNSLDSSKNVKLEKYVVTDNLESCFDVATDIDDQIKVYMTEEDQGTAETTHNAGMSSLPAKWTALVKDNDYTVGAAADSTDTTLVDGETATASAFGPIMTVTLTPTGRNKLYNSTGGTEGTYTNKTLVVELPVIMNAKILTDKYTKLTAENKFTTTVKNEGTPETNTDSNEQKVHSGKITVTKTGNDNAEASKYKNAEFKIALSKEDAEAGTFLKKDNGKVYASSDDGYAALGADKDYVAKTGTDAIATFEGIKCCYKDGNVNKPMTYYLVETKAPDGYNLLTAPVKVTFGDDTKTEDYHADGEETKNVNAAVTVKDTKSVELPLTGGIGAVLFVIIGIVMIGAGVIYGVVVRKKKTA